MFVLPPYHLRLVGMNKFVDCPIIQSVLHSKMSKRILKFCICIFVNKLIDQIYSVNEKIWSLPLVSQHFHFPLATLKLFELVSDDVFSRSRNIYQSYNSFVVV